MRNNKVMSTEKKRIVWSAAFFLLILLSVPSVVFYNAGRKYFSFIKSWDVGVIKPAKTSRVPAEHRLQEMEPEREAPAEVKYITFSLEAPSAKYVNIAADFNKWSPQDFKLSRGKNGVWEAVVPLPPGRYNYLYYVDDVPMIDIKNPMTGYHSGRQTSVITVQ